VAVTGCGTWGRNLVRNFHELDALVAVHDTAPATAATIADRYGVLARPFEQILADPDIDAVVIATPAATHATVARQALAAGKHVFVEKPLALEPRDAEALEAMATGNGLVLMVGHLMQYHPAFLKLKSLVDEGALGRIQYLYSHRLNLGKVRREENALWSFAPHDVSMILALAGGQPDQVTATGSACLHATVADVTTTHLHFPGGQTAHIFVSWLHPFKEQKLVVVGDRAMAVFDDAQPWPSKLVLYPHRIDWIAGMPTPSRAEAVPVPVEPAEPLRQECTHFLDCVSTGARPRTDGAEGLAVLRVLEAAQRAMDGAQAPSSSPAHGPSKHEGVTVHETAAVDDPVVIGPGTRIWHFSHILGQVTIGRDCSIGQNVVIGPRVSVGDRCKIQNNVSLYEGVTLEDGVFCGPSCVFTNVLTPRAEISRKDEFRPTVVRRGASIGANATIVCGHTLGEHCLIAAGAVVTRDVPAFALMAGVPARRIGWVSHSGERLGANLVCPRTGQRYRQTGPDTLEDISHGA
jgi:predicted dehydrogenase/acetyltransferase-like isoleucine patch superfamily enzyme